MFSSICFLCIRFHSFFFFSCNNLCQSFISSIYAFDHCFCIFGSFAPIFLFISFNFSFTSLLFSFVTSWSFFVFAYFINLCNFTTFSCCCCIFWLFFLFV